MISNNKFAPSTNINCRQLLPLSPKHKFKDARWFLINVNVSGSVFAASQFSLHSCCNLCRSYHPSLQFAKSIVYFYFGRSLHPPEALANFLATWPDPILISPRGARKIFFCLVWGGTEPLAIFVATLNPKPFSPRFARKKFISFGRFFPPRGSSRQFFWNPKHKTMIEKKSQN